MTTTTLSLTVEPRTLTGNVVRKLAKQSKIPGVIYGNGVSGKLFEIDYNTFVRLYKESGKTHIVEITLGKDTYPCLVHDIDVNPVSGRAVHIDMLSVNLKKKVVVGVPVELVGEAPAVLQGAIVNQALKEIEVEALPSDVPETIVVSLDSLATMQDSIRIKDLVADKYTFVNDPEEVIVSVVAEEEEKAPEATAVEAAATPEAPAAQ